MFHHLNERNFWERLAGDDLIVVGRDIGPLRCLESLLRDYGHSKRLLFYAQGASLRTYLESSSNLRSYEYVSTLKLVWMLVTRRSADVLILQSSYVSFAERVVHFFNKRCYVLQDFKDDFKFGVNAKYITAFTSIPDERYLNSDILVIPTLRPNIACSSNTGILGPRDVLIIGARDLLKKNGSMEFLNEVLVRVKEKNLRCLYKPHPAENVEEYGEDFFLTRGITVIEGLPYKNSWPKYIISPHSSLAFDIPEQINLTNGDQFRVMHSFGADYDSMILAYPGFKKMLSTKSQNFTRNDLYRFFG